MSPFRLAVVLILGLAVPPHTVDRNLKIIRGGIEKKKKENRICVEMK